MEGEIKVIRDSKGRWTPGNAGGSKPKGAVQRTSKEVRQILTNIVNKKLETIEQDLDSLTPEKRIHALVAICQIILPKYSAVAVTSEGENVDRVKQVMMFGDNRIEF